MDFSEGSSSEILGRLSTAYGVETQKQLAEKLGVSAANVSNWVQRNSVPGSAFVRCALDTGCDLAWLAKGRFENANKGVHLAHKHSIGNSGKELIETMLLTGGRPVLQRVMDAYGFNTQKELSDYLGISTGTISTWVRREYFPGDVVIACALETNACLEWLALGDKCAGNIPVGDAHSEIQVANIPKLILKAGKLEELGFWKTDINFIPKNMTEPKLIISKNNSWLADFGIVGISNGIWVISIADKLDIYEVNLLANSLVSLKNSLSSFQCRLSDIVGVAHILAKYEQFV